MQPTLLAAGLVLFGTLTPLERERLVAHLEMTASWLAGEVSGLSPAQLQFRPAPGAWNILDNLDHLVVAGPIYWRQFQEAMKAPPNWTPDPARDADVLWYGIDRTQRQKAVPSEAPQHPMRDVAAGLAALAKLHREMIEYVKTTSQDLRRHVVERERSDAYQWLLLISSHEQRHILQIREIKANPNFPKK